MRINLTKKDLVNLVYMQLGFSKQISENHWFYRSGNRNRSKIIGFIHRATEIVEKPLVLQA